MSTLVESIANWVSAFRYEALPASAIEKTKRILLDTVGCALGAVGAPPFRIAHDVESEQGGKAQSTVLGLGEKMACDQATFLNGIALRCLDYNDYVLDGRPLHPSINVAPAMAIAEMQGASGRDLLLAVVIGYEVAMRLRDATPSGPTVGWDYCATTTSYSSAAVAGKLLCLDPFQIGNALVIAGSHASTLGEVRRGGLSMWKGAAEAMAARNGVFATLLARGGMTGPAMVLEGKFGYGKMVAGSLDEEILRQQEGEPRILRSCIKLWPCVVTAQAPIAAALQIRDQNVMPDQIKSIIVGLCNFAYRQQQSLMKEKILSRETADHSVAYAVARTILDGEVRLQHFEGDELNDPRTLALMEKITFGPEPSLEALYPASLGAQLEVRLQNGNVLKSKVLFPPGVEKNPLDDGSLMRKFLTLSEPVLGTAKAKRAIEIILSLENSNDLSELMDAITRTRKTDSRAS
jgi:2-methylcitrate dehydratase